MLKSEARASWIAVDWGTSRLRAWAMDATNEPLDMRFSDAGMGILAPDQFEPALIELINDWLDPNTSTEVIACGMVGARQGWVEARYANTPCPPISDKPTVVECNDRRLRVAIVPGVSQLSPADVMRGEETQIAGYLHVAPDFSGTICLPGTHTKWAQVTDGTIRGFQTSMTGELFALLSEKSVLRHSLSADGFDETAFFGGADTALADPFAVQTQLFGLRAEGLLHELGPVAARSRLSGLLIGAEIAAMRSSWERFSVVTIGAQALSQLYAQVLRRVGADVEMADGDKMTLSGLISAHHKLGTH